MINTIDELLEIARNEHEISKVVNELGGFSERIVQSDKLGFDWIETLLGDKVVRQEYVEQANPVGVSEESAIAWYEGCPLINNAYYNINDKIYVYMSGEFIEW